MNERLAVNRLREAMHRADIDEMDETEEIGQQAVAIALSLSERPPAPRPDTEEERQRALDAAFGDVMEIVNRHRLRLGRRVCSMSDARVTRQMFELIRSMAGTDGGTDNDPSFSA
jgi:hypothetical protein